MGIGYKRNNDFMIMYINDRPYRYRDEDMTTGN